MFARIVWFVGVVFALGMVGPTDVVSTEDPSTPSVAPSASAEHVCIDTGGSGCACVHLYCLEDVQRQVAATGAPSPVIDLPFAESYN